MKKIITAMTLAVLLLVTLLACSDSKLPKEYEKHISEIRSEVYEFSENGTQVTVYSGKRENPYSINGTTGELKEFTQIVFRPPVIISALKYTYTLTSGTDVFTGEFTVHPFGTKYVAEFANTVDAAELTLEVKEGENLTTFTLPSVKTAEMISWEDAILIAKNVLTEELETMMDGKNFKGEVFVRLICDPENNTDKHFWYVAFSSADRTFAVLIDPITQEILATKK